MGATTAARPAPSLWHLWEYYNEILPLPDAVDFNASAHAWASLVGVRLTRREVGILKLLYDTHVKRESSDSAPMVPATDDNVLKLFSMLAKKPEAS